MQGVRLVRTPAAKSTGTAVRGLALRRSAMLEKSTIGEGCRVWKGEGCRVWKGTG